MSDMPDFERIARKIIQTLNHSLITKDDLKLVTAWNDSIDSISDALEQAYAQGRASKITWPSDEDFTKLVGIRTDGNNSPWYIYDWLKKRVEELNK